MQGIFDSSGMMYFYTQQQPLHIAGTMTVEYNTFPYLTLIIPPNAEQFNITATCPNRCHDEVSQCVCDRIEFKILHGLNNFTDFS